jgi:very-short-patch-repair endonuclease
MSAMTRSTKLDEAALLTTLRKQQHVIGRGQALACGMTEGALRHRTAPGGRWRRLLPGVYLAATGLPTMVQLEVAALLYAGSGSVITGAAALRHQGLRAPRTERITVLIPAGRAVRSVSFVQVWRTTRMPPVFLEDGPVRVALPPRAAADAARSLTGLRDVRAVIADAVQKNQCPAFLLAEELDSGSTSGSALPRRVLAEISEGIRSVAEAEFRDLIRRARLPMPLFNAGIYAGQEFVAIADAWWPDAGVVAEVDSREWHLSPADWENTMKRHAAMTAHGILVLHFTPSQIRRDEATVAADLRSAIAAGRGRPPLALRTRPATA